MSPTDATGLSADDPVNHFQFSATIGKLASALVKAQKAFPPIAKDKTADTGKYKYDYADLAKILKATVPILTEHGLAVIQPPITTTAAKSVVILTVLLHESGEWMASDLTVPVVDASDPQKLGSAVSYGRRYAYCGMVGVAPQGEDDDAKSARQRQDANKRAIRVREDPPEPTSDPNDERPITTVNRDGSKGGQLGRLKAIMAAHKVPEKAFVADLKDVYGYTKWTDIQRRHYDQIVALAMGYKSVETE